jgi:hypothetical protein
MIINYHTQNVILIGITMCQLDSFDKYFILCSKLRASILDLVYEET